MKIKKSIKIAIIVWLIISYITPPLLMGSNAGFWMMWLLYWFGLQIGLAYIFANCFIFMKMGREWWEVIIPFYNLFVFHEKIYGNGWWCIFPTVVGILSPLIPPISLVISFILLFLWGIVQNLRLAYSFNKSSSFALGLIIPGLNPIFTIMLAYGNSEFSPLEDFELSRPFNYVHKTAEDSANNMSVAATLVNKTEYEDKLSCRNCGEALNPGAVFCPKCGTRV